MRVSELIEILAKCPADQKIVVLDQGFLKEIRAIVQYNADNPIGENDEVIAIEFQKAHKKPTAN
ncbi:MAG TPA: hypothetical protein VN519_06935 [Bryobacteraceae bacterium]|nr:hypothetical protein [Bryobacteraceae bacterium]